MERDVAIPILQREAARVLGLAEATGGDLTAAVPSCPDWDFDGLVNHLASVYNWVGTTVSGRLSTPPSRPDLPQRPEGLSAPEWMKDRFDRLATGLSEIPSDVLIWNFGLDSPSSAGFWWRRQVHESAIHRVDAELTAGVPVSQLEPDIAADTVSELFAIFRIADVTDLAPDHTAAEAASPGDGSVPATIHLHATDIEGAEWTVDTSARTITRRHTKGDVALRGTAWALARWCWGRPVDGEIEAFGDLAAAESWRASIVS